MTTLSLFLLSALAHAGAVDDYAARHDWACTYGAQTTCGGPDSWFGIDASHTVVLCGEGGNLADCGHTWRLNGSDELVALAFESWGAALEGQLGNENWVRTPYLSNPDVWLATLRDPGTLAALEVGRGYVQVTLEEREPCFAKGLGERLNAYVEPVLPEVEKGVDPVAEAKKLAWEETAWIEAKPITAEVVASVMGRPALTALPERDPLQRWILLSSEPFQCMLELRKLNDPRAGVDIALAEWREFNQPTAEEKRAMRKHEREMARIARKGQDVDTKEDTLSDEMPAVLDEEEAIAAEEPVDDVDIADLLGEDDPAPDPEPVEEGEDEEERPMPKDIESDEDEFQLDDDF